MSSWNVKCKKQLSVHSIRRVLSDDELKHRDAVLLRVTKEHRYPLRRYSDCEWQSVSEGEGEEELKECFWSVMKYTRITTVELQ